VYARTKWLGGMSLSMMSSQLALSVCHSFYTDDCGARFAGTSYFCRDAFIPLDLYLSIHDSSSFLSIARNRDTLARKHFKMTGLSERNFYSMEILPPSTKT
jgi:hypothetical protein